MILLTDNSWFSCLDALVSSVLSCAPETAFALEEYSAWYDLIDFLSHGRLPERWHTISSGLDGVLRCFTKDESLEATREVHKDSCGQHQGGINHSCKLAITDFPFDRVKFGQLCRTCQLHTPFEGPTSTLCCCVWDFALNIN